MKPEPTGGKPPLEERIFYFVLWLTVAGFIGCRSRCGWSAPVAHSALSYPYRCSWL